MRAGRTGLAALALGLAAGFALGRWSAAGGWASGDRDPGPAAVSPAPVSSPVAVAPPAVRRDGEPAPAAGAASAPEQPGTGDSLALERLLEQRRFREATALYYAALERDAGESVILRPAVDSFFERCFDSCDEATFYDLADAWLATFYDDIPVLLTLADYQEGHGQPEPAANSLLLAQTYALSSAERRAVDAAQRRLVRRVDERLSAEQRWIELLGFYEFLTAIAVSTREQELRRAQLYLRQGEEARARALLNDLQRADDGSDPRWSDRLQDLLASEQPATAPSAEPSDSVPLVRRGDGYVVEVTLNNRAGLRLLVDTGASVTALSHDSFRRLYRPEFTLQGVRLFNTANGYTRGNIYRARSLTLGEERLQGVDIAVLDLTGLDGVDGLLGMNVLRQFRFEIDQTAAALHLSRRDERP
jgi:clan AA aspartic protease (TIGR02281 family)